ncbi:hypothetical protein [Acinetobacter populi]|uniref:Membrane-binding protein n=1 Tax=Acinetobacter populi TaxID=1582270 RepID=A0A1Z9YUM8_9GAMM|nr:hypothetical protein [Acinetobacter populi]OUY05932.1 hypothetical protein CAP51_14560 [Acinetobacter populi]
MHNKTFTFLPLTLLLAAVTPIYAAPTAVSNQQNIAGTKIATTQPVVAYFNTSEQDFNYSNTPVKGGFYRVLLGRDDNGHFLIQDLFTDSGNKHTDPYWIIDPEGLNYFDLDFVNGPIQGYYATGKIAFKGTFKNGSYISSFDSFYPSGELANRYAPAEKGRFHEEYFYKNGQKAAVIDYENYDISKQEVWDNQGKKVSDENTQQTILDEINNQLALDQ